jgi:PAS domain S-box-containing protein
VTSGALPSNFGEVRRRLEELEAGEAERQRSEQVQSALYRIAELASAAQDLHEFYRAVHGVVGELMDARNFFIALYDEERQLIGWPYYVDEVDADIPDPNQWEPFGEGNASGATAYVLRTGAPQLLDYGGWRDLVERGEIEAVGVTSEDNTWVGVPLMAEGRTVGVLVVQSYTKDVRYTEHDKELLAFVGQHIGAALSRARAIEETRQRNAELALINSVQDALAGELELQAIYDVVGDKIQEVFDAQVVDIGIYDESAGLIRFPYQIERGVRFPDEPLPVIGFRKHVMDTREPLMIAEASDEVAERYGNPLVHVGERVKSALFVPLVVGERATGVISLQNVDREHAFSESDEQLLETLAGSLSVALENARLVHETRQRNAELALISSVQDAIAGELDLQAIYDVVGDKIHEIFDAQVVDIGMFDFAAGLCRYAYTIERGVRLPDTPSALTSPTTQELLRTKAPLLVNDVRSWELEHGTVPMIGEPALSMLVAPLLSGDEVVGRISLQNLDRANVFTDNDVRLLATLAGSLSVALENARLVHETRQRNAELALINSVQDALAGELELQAIYNSVGDSIRDVFDAQGVYIATLDEATGLQHYPYIIERGERLQAEPAPLRGFAKHVLENRQSLLLGENVAAEMERYGSDIVAGESPKSVLFVPLVSGGKGAGVISLQNVDREHAFSESDRQLLETLAGSLSVALENARLVHETRQRNAELALINSVQDAIAGELEPQAIYDAVGDRIRDVFDAQVVVISILDDATGRLHDPYIIERGERLQSEPRPFGGFAKHVLETRVPLLLTENVVDAVERYGAEILAGEWPKSALFVPLVTGGNATGMISLQNVDREHAFGESDRQLLETLAGSLSVALENARLVHETRQRVTELGTVNSVGQALASQLELEALIELVGERVRETFDADIAYVALHDEFAGRIDFVYYYESGERREEPPLEYGEGLTSQIIDSRQPLLLNHAEQYEGLAQVGTPSRSYVGVPIMVGSKAIGVISVQSIEEEGRFGEADSRLLATIAANVGVAIQNARLFTEVERQRGYLESLVSISPAAVVVLDSEERVTDWNPAAADLFGYAAEDAIGRPIDDLVFGDTGREEGREITRQALEEGRAQRITRRRRRDGSRVDVELMLVPLRADGEHVGFLGVYHDVTELQRARHEAEAANQAKSAFLATMSHEIRTPMNAVIGMTDLLLGTELTGEQREFAEVVRSSGNALLHVIDDILDYSKIEAGKLDLEREPFSLRDCVEGALEIVAPRAWEKGIELGCLIDEAAPAGVLGDEARLRQVLLNLLSNALKFTEAGEVVVLVRAEATAPGSYRLELSVRDTGIGIAPDRIGKLFTSFSQVDASTTRRFGGTGLGLAISKRLVELMDGAISVESEVDSGSTFRITLPVTEADVPTAVAFEDGAAQLEGKRILIVDDNATNREIVTRHARSWGMEPVAVERPSEAVALVEERATFDVAVLDMMMPEMDGLELAEEIRRRRGEQDFPLLLLTSLGRLPEAQLGGVFQAQLAKPLKASQLFNALLQVLTAGEREDETAEIAMAPARAMSSLRILLAEDNPMNQKVALRFLQQLGYRADVASNGLEALAALERQPYDVVLMDVQMPELDGLDATRRICERWPVGSRPHIIAMTANAMPEDREACFAAGMNDYVAKPIRADELARALTGARPVTRGNGSSKGVGENLDAAALQNLRELGGDDFLVEVVDAFLADAPALIATLRSSFDQLDVDQLRRAAHTLKSNGATLGAGDFADLCRTVEQHAKDGRLEGVSQLIDRIRDEYETLEELLTSLRSEAVP